MNAAVASWVDRLVGPHPRIRRRMRTQFVCVVMYLACCALAFVATSTGMMRPGFAPLFTVFSIVQLSVFYGLLRSGWSLRWRDPGMMFTQNLVGLVGIAFAYAFIVPQHRGAVLMIVGVVVVFGMYTLSPRQALVIGACTALVLGPVMLVLPTFDPQWFHRDLERVRFELLAGTLPALSLLARYFAIWRERLARQTRELQEALAQVQELATRDRLTGCFNRRFMVERLEQAAAASGFCVALIDLDHFKHVNDHHGHAVGDEVLRRFAQACAGVLGADDVLARWGGEEFLILFPACGAAQARERLDRLASRLKTQHVSDAVPHLRVAFSAGVAQHKPHETIDRTLERADRALYLAKTEGRDRSLLARHTTVYDDARLLGSAH